MGRTDRFGKRLGGGLERGGGVVGEPRTRAAGNGKMGVRGRAVGKGGAGAVDPGVDEVEVVGEGCLRKREVKGTGG